MDVRNLLIAIALCQVLGFITGIAYLYLGGMALLLSAYAGSWGVTGGLLGLLAGLGYLTATAVAVRKARQVTRPRAAGTVSVSP